MQAYQRCSVQYIPDWQNVLFSHRGWDGDGFDLDATHMVPIEPEPDGEFVDRSDAFVRDASFRRLVADVEVLHGDVAYC